jgi:hypothetical protein
VLPDAIALARRLGVCGSGSRHADVSYHVAVSIQPLMCLFTARFFSVLHATLRQNTRSFAHSHGNGDVEKTKLFCSNACANHLANKGRINGII